MYECKRCTFKTTHKTNFRDHMFKHPEETSSYNFKKCIYCKAVFRRKLQADEHVLKKHPEHSESVTSKVYECKRCIFKTTHRTNFQSHLSKHPEENPSFNLKTCKYCEAVFKLRVCIAKLHSEITQ
nr:unnamed protein product [Callosobruchus analis]